MKAKKILACVLAGTLSMSGVLPVLAAPGNETGSTTGELPVYSFDIVDVIIPTSFTAALNPQGLEVTVTENVAGASGDESNGYTSTAQVLSYNYGIINNSTTGKKVTVDFAVTTADGITFGTAEDVAAASTDAEAGNVLALAVLPSNGDVMDADGAVFDAETVAADLVNIQATYGTDTEVYLEDGTGTVGFYLGGATYILEDGSDVTLGDSGSADNDVSGKYKVGTIGDVTAFSFTGSMNNNVSWTGITSQPTVTATYTFETADENNVVKVDGTDAMIELADSAPSIAVTDYTLAADTALEVALNFGEGPSAADAVASVTYTAGEAVTTLDSSTAYTVADTTLTINADTVNAIIAAGATTISVTFNDTAPTSVDLTCTLPEPADAAPSIATTTYTMVSGTDLEIPVDLGRGDLAATGIKKVQFTNTSGSVASLTSGTDYSFDSASGIYTLKAARVTKWCTSFPDGLDMTITFNDTASTPIIINLAQ